MENVPKFEDESLNSLANALPSFLLRSKADNTVKSYLRGLGYWRIWTKNFPEIDVLPVKESHLALCIVSMIQMGTSFPALTQMCYGVRWAQKLTGYKDPLKLLKLRWYVLFTIQQNVYCSNLQPKKNQLHHIILKNRPGSLDITVRLYQIYACYLFAHLALLGSYAIVNWLTFEETILFSTRNT